MKLRKINTKNTILAKGVFDTIFIGDFEKTKEQESLLYVFTYTGCTTHKDYKLPLYFCVEITKNNAHITACINGVGEKEDLEGVVELEKEELTALFAYLLAQENRQA